VKWMSNQPALCTPGIKGISKFNCVKDKVPATHAKHTNWQRWYTTWWYGKFDSTISPF
jgi:hypothetical protein